jgi:Domain of unknown function (DUF5679)
MSGFTPEIGQNVDLRRAERLPRVSAGVEYGRSGLKTCSDGLRRASPQDPAATTQRIESKEAVMAETWSGEFYCVKCKEKREAEGEVRVNDKGTRMAKAVCPVCGTNLNRILGKA